MITLEQYFQGKPHTPEHEANAEVLLAHVNALCAAAAADGILMLECPNTGTQISGSKGGSGDGGFRLQTSTTGSSRSSHKEGRGVDVYDPGEALESWLTDQKLERFGLHREHPSATPGWVHLTTRAPGSGRRTFYP